MKYKALLTGSLTSAIDDLFSHSASLLDCVTTSARYDDMVRHIKIFSPDIFIICLSNENNALYSCIERLKAECKQEDVTFAIMGARSDCESFLKQSTYEPDLIFVKPMTIASIMNKIADAMEDKAREKEKEALEEQKAQAMLVENQARANEAKANEVKTSEARVNKDKKHILVIDDDIAILRTIKEQLEELYSIGTAISGNIALRFLEKKTTDLILLDYEMPGENGVDILKQLRANDNTKDIPVIFLTGVSDVERIKNVLSMKPQGYLLKPVDRKKLTKIIDDTLKKRK